jgi:hypothetical protein
MSLMGLSTLQSADPNGRQYQIRTANLRLEALPRALVTSDDLVKRAMAELGSADAVIRQLIAQAPQTIRGLEHPIAIWAQARAGE